MDRQAFPKESTSNKSRTILQKAHSVRYSCYKVLNAHGFQRNHNTVNTMLPGFDMKIMYPKYFADRGDWNPRSYNNPRHNKEIHNHAHTTHIQHFVIQLKLSL